MKGPPGRACSKMGSGPGSNDSTSYVEAVCSTRAVKWDSQSTRWWIPIRWPIFGGCVPQKSRVFSVPQKSRVFSGFFLCPETYKTTHSVGLWRDFKKSLILSGSFAGRELKEKPFYGSWRPWSAHDRVHEYVGHTHARTRTHAHTHTHTNTHAHTHARVRACVRVCVWIFITWS